MPAISDVLRGCRTRLQAARDQVARDPGLLAVAGAVLLICAPVLPGFSRLVVLPALLLAPGYALLRLLGRTTGLRSISVAVPVSLVLAVCASLVLDVTGVRLGPLVLGSVLGGVTALFLAGSYGRQMVADLPRPHRSVPSGDWELDRSDHLAATGALRAMFTRDFVYLGVSALQVVLAALITPILTRRVGVGQFGQLALAIVVAQLLGVIL